MNKWVALLIGFTTGLGIGGYIINRYNNKKFDEVANDIYNECYRDIMQEMEKDEKPQETSVEEPVMEIYKKSAQVYKPSISEVLAQRIENEELVEGVQFEIGFDEANNVVVKEDEDSYLISRQEYEEENLHYAKGDIFWYSVDNVFTDDDDQILDVDDPIFVDMSRDALESGLRKGDDLFLRMVNLDTDYQIHHLKGSYSDIMYETVQERNTRIGKRKMKEEN